MFTRRVTLALALAAIAGAASGELRAQELTLPPAPSSASEKDGTAFRAENGPCFYNPYSWMLSGRFNQSALASELKDLTSVDSFGRCIDHYALTPADFLGRWSYLLLDGVRRPKSVSREKVIAAWEASRRAAAEREEKERIGHTWVPTIGNGHGSDEALEARTVAFRVAPGPKPPSYNGIPIVERNRSWERVQTPDGRRVWRETALPPTGYRGSAGLASRRQTTSGQERFGDRTIQRQEGVSRRSSYSAGTAPRPSSSASSSSSSRPRSPMVGKKNKEQ